MATKRVKRVPRPQLVPPDQRKKKQNPQDETVARRKRTTDALRARIGALEFELKATLKRLAKLEQLVG